MNPIEWKNERRKIKDLVPWEKNPRKITDEQLENLKRSIEKFNYAAPIIINADGRIVAGHMRTRALLSLGRGEEEIDVRVASRELSQAEFEELAIRDNANGGEWDLKSLMAFDLDLLSDFGMDSNLVDTIRKKVKEDGYDAEEEVSKIQTPKTTAGTLYILGRHRLLCGDSTKQEDFARLMDGRKARLVFTDPPYSVNYQSDASGNIKNDNLSQEDALDFYIKVLKNLHDFSEKDVTLYWWMANKLNWLNRQAWQMSAWQMSQIVIWLKETMVFSRGQDYHRCYEPCMVGWKVGYSHFRNKKISTFKDIWMLDESDFSQMPDVWYQNRDKTSEYVHPNQKPVRLAERAIKKNSEPGDIVLDAFGGSGSTLMACEQMDRACYSIELDPKFCDVIVDRWEKFTGLKAVTVSKGE